MDLSDAVAPIPINPFTGKLPAFAVEGEVATLSYVGLGTEADLIYKLRVEK